MKSDSRPVSRRASFIVTAFVAKPKVFLPRENVFLREGETEIERERYLEIHLTRIFGRAVRAPHVFFFLRPRRNRTFPRRRKRRIFLPLSLSTVAVSPSFHRAGSRSLSIARDSPIGQPGCSIEAEDERARESRAAATHPHHVCVHVPRPRVRINEKSYRRNLPLGVIYAMCFLPLLFSSISGWVI